MPNFTTVGYKADNGKIYRMKVAEDVKDVVGNAGTPTEKKANRVKTSKRSSEIGIRPRMLVLRRRVGTGADSYLKYLTIPIATPEAYASNDG